MPKRPIRKKVEKHFYTCQSCDYAGGFHVTFKKREKPETYKVVLMCPQCEQTYDIDWQIQTQ
jgi:transcription elongation factor Elf1